LALLPVALLLFLKARMTFRLAARARLGPNVDPTVNIAVVDAVAVAGIFPLLL
jgi:hypothetical protein